MAVDRPGVYTMTAAEYHADPCLAPSLSSSLARELLGYSPQHAWYQHPKLNPAFEPEEDDKFDVGTAAHAYLLEGESGFVVVLEQDWRKKDAQTARAGARLIGKVPLLGEQWERVQTMAAAARAQLKRHEDPPIPLTGGQPERTLVWREGEIWCRARLDWLHDDRRTIDDYKTTGACANPAVWARTQLFSMGYDVQAAFYLRGLRAVAGVDATFRFVVQEAFAPYQVAVIGLTPQVLALAERKVRAAIAAWTFCLAEGRWPGYPTRTCYAELPGWEETRWLEREVRAAQQDATPVGAGVDDGRPLEEQLFGEDR